MEFVFFSVPHQSKRRLSRRLKEPGLAAVYKETPNCLLRFGSHPCKTDLIYWRPTGYWDHGEPDPSVSGIFSAWIRKSVGDWVEVYTAWTKPGRKPQDSKLNTPV